MIFSLLVLSYLVDATPVPAYNLQCEKDLVGLTRSKLSSCYYFVTFHGTLHTLQEVPLKQPSEFWSVEIFHSKVFTGIVESPKSINRRFHTVDGIPLKGEQLYFWKVIW